MENLILSHSHISSRPCNVRDVFFLPGLSIGVVSKFKAEGDIFPGFAHRFWKSQCDTVWGSILTLFLKSLRFAGPPSDQVLVAVWIPVVAKWRPALGVKFPLFLLKSESSLSWVCLKISPKTHCFILISCHCESSIYGHLISFDIIKKHHNCHHLSIDIIQNHVSS